MVSPFPSLFLLGFINHIQINANRRRLTLASVCFRRPGLAVVFLQSYCIRVDRIGLRKRAVVAEEDRQVHLAAELPTLAQPKVRLGARPWWAEHQAVPSEDPCRRAHQPAHLLQMGPVAPKPAMVLLSQLPTYCHLV